MRKTKYVDRIYFDAKKKCFYHVRWDHSVDKVQHWWFTNYNGHHGYIKGKLSTPDTWLELGYLPERYIEDCSKELIEKLKKKKQAKLKRLTKEK